MEFLLVFVFLWALILEWIDGIRRKEYEKMRRLQELENKKFEEERRIREQIEREKEQRTLEIEREREKLKKEREVEYWAEYEKVKPRAIDVPIYPMRQLDVGQRNTGKYRIMPREDDFWRLEKIFEEYEIRMLNYLEFWQSEMLIEVCEIGMLERWLNVYDYTNEKDRREIASGNAEKVKQTHISKCYEMSRKLYQDNQIVNRRKKMADKFKPEVSRNSEDPKK